MGGGWLGGGGGGGGERRGRLTDPACVIHALTAVHYVVF